MKFLGTAQLGCGCRCEISGAPVRERNEYQVGEFTFRLIPCAPEGLVHEPGALEKAAWKAFKRDASSDRVKRPRRGVNVGEVVSAI